MNRKIPDPPLPEVLISTNETKNLIAKRVARGRMRKLGPRLYTTDMTSDPKAIIRRHLWQIVAGYCPGAILADRTGLESGPAPDGSVFVISDRVRKVELPGITINSRKGQGPLPSDRPFMRDLFLPSRSRGFIENFVPTRKIGGVSRTLPRAEIESRLEREIAAIGPEGANALRDLAQEIAPALGLKAEVKELSAVIGAMLGTREAALSAPAAIARAEGRPYDPKRLERFVEFQTTLHDTSPVIRQAAPLSDAGRANLAFFEAYFSNFIEGTEFPVAEAREIVFDGVIPEDRPADAHDVLGTFRVVSDVNEMSRTPETVEDLLAILRRRHAMIMEARPDKRPGRFKDRPNHTGGRYFVAPDLIEGTLVRGFDIYRSLDAGFPRAAFMAFLIAEVHPFADGNGRISRVMMNAELVSTGEQRILIPSVYRNNYLAALRALTNDGYGRPLVRTLDFAQRYARSLPFDRFEEAEWVMAATRAFMKPDEADEEGVRLEMPNDDLLSEAQARFRRSAQTLS